MSFTQEEFGNLVKFLNAEGQRGVFVLDEFVTVGKFWEDVKGCVKDEKFELNVQQLEVLIRILNVCLGRKGNEPDVLRMVLSLLDKATTLKDTLTTDSKVQELN